MTKQEYITENYTHIKGWLRNITKGEKPHLFEDMVHEVLEIFLNHPKSQDSVDTGTARFFLVRLALNTWRSSTSRFHYQYRDSFLDYNQDYDPVDDGYDVTLDIMEEIMIQGLAEMYDMDKHSRYECIIIMTYHSMGDNYSEVGRKLGMKHTTVRKIYLRGIAKLKQIIQTKINQYKDGTLQFNQSLDNLLSRWDDVGGGDGESAVSLVNQLFKTRYFQIT